MRALLVLPFAAALASCSTAPGTTGTGSDHRAESAASMQRVTALLKASMHERGQAKMSRIDLDEVQRVCNLNSDNPPAEVARQLEESQLKLIRFPEGSLIGNWKNGEKIAQSGRGMTWSDKPGSSGGSCYNCHQISPQEEAYGTIGPSLAGYGKVRGNRPEIQRYVYGKIYNSKAYNACSQMPRFGQSGTLNEQQIKDLTALLLDPESPVNR